MDTNQQVGTGVRVLGPTDGEVAGAPESRTDRFMIDGAATGGRLSVVEHTLPPHVLAGPLHHHTREDEYSYVLEGRLGAVLGDQEVVAEAGDLVFKPRGQWHTFWNPGDTPTRILELITPRRPGGPVPRARRPRRGVGPGDPAGPGGPLRLPGRLPGHGDHPPAARADVLAMLMDASARTPEELETLLEDAFVLHDRQALTQLFDPGAILVAGGGLPEARGHRQIVRVATELWDSDRRYLADPRRVLQVRDTALVLAGRAINVARRAHHGPWRYAISLLDPERTAATKGW
jgi:mannose-6-phosphate isomerase-like protein (cupin superfamily)